MHEIFYVNLCLQLIEARLNWGNREHWVYDDFKRLQHLIFEASSISLSVHTLERLFGKLKTHKNYNPQTETKNALAVFLGYSSWAHFRESHPVVPEAPVGAAGSAAAQAAPLPFRESLSEAAGPQKSPAQASLGQDLDQEPAGSPVKPAFKGLVLAAALLLGFIAALYFYYQQGGPGAAMPAAIQFKATNSYGKGPHTVKFTYRIPSQFAKAVYADFGTSDPLWKVDKKARSFFKTYVYPGVFPVQLKTRDSVLARASIFIDSEGWMGFSYNTYEDNTTRNTLPASLLVSEGRLYTDPGQLSQELTKGKYYLEYTNIRDFQVDGDNLTFDTRFRSKAESGGQLCNDMWFKLIGTQGELKMHFLVPGCSGFVQMIFGEQKLDGHARDLSAFARDVSDWKNARMEVANKQVAIYFEDKLIYKTTYKQAVGKIMGIAITSKGAGETDQVRLYNARKELVFADDFE